MSGREMAASMRAVEQVAPQESELDAAELGTWLAWRIREAGERDAQVKTLVQRVHAATAALAGLEDAALTAALRTQEQALWALIRLTAESHSESKER